MCRSSPGPRQRAAVGVAPADIDAVVLSHLHFDHAGGMRSAHGDGLPRLVFPRGPCLRRRPAPGPRDLASFVPALHDLRSASGRLTLVGDDGASDLTPLVRFQFSDGHAPALMLPELALRAGPLRCAAELVPGVPWVHVPITMGYDRLPERLIDEKQRPLARLADAGGRCSSRMVRRWRAGR